MGNRFISVSLMLGALSVAACGGSSKNKKDKTLAGMGDTKGLTVPRVDKSLCDTKGKKIVTYDINKDSQPDVWKLYASSNEGGTTVEILTCKQVDLDHDGKKDYVQTYSRTGEILAEEFDFTFEGSMDAREHYDSKTGKIYLIERDTDHDQKPDVWEKYGKDGRVESVRRDRNADGKPDLWEQYKNGELVAILYDDDFDNKVDRKDQLKTPPKEEEAGDTPDSEGGESDTGESDGPTDEESAIEDSTEGTEDP